MRMTRLVAGVGFLLVAAWGVEASTSSGWRPLPWARTRPASKLAADFIADAAARSDTVNAMLHRIEHTDVVVYVVLDMAASRPDPRGWLWFVGGAAGVRYLAVAVQWPGATSTERIEYLAHELQHALEVADAPDVRDEAGLRRLYERIGWRSGAGGYETEGARQAGRRARAELREESQ